jgi:transposase
VGKVGVVSLDTHKRFSKAVVLDWSGEVIEEEVIAHGDRGEMERFFARFEPATDVIMEATFNWPWIADAADEMGLNAHLGHPRKLRDFAKGQAKSDRKDAAFNGQVWLGGVLFPESWLAPREVRRMRAHFRMRQLLVNMRTSLKNSVHGILFKLGITVEGKASDLFSNKGRGVLEGLKLDDAERGELNRKLQVIDDLTGHIEDVEEEILPKLKHDPRAAILMSLPGVGKLTAYAILAEAGDFARFPNGRALASYAGLLPVTRESAGKQFERKTSKSCNRFLRWAMLEAVSGAVRKSPRMKSLNSRVKARNPKRQGKARVAVARELIELAHLLVTRGENYKELPATRGRRTSKS